ncbi:LPXTG cell wall anchor domain-containing protein [Streptomyces roseirectus]|uniref:LPXTG cell wall anchor domain-containing protein n=1 Tax=Streptomyces roseirectus TaxID=2768066 RepID=A0A7H0IGK1_9ACTN|nr:LPXTG cell wall anchor domain-containing protein [Streptomyces roseirectus]QNP71917.1 LPXTG cell wall anchor domain-containing protein [Streptomyces roseirectus]
MRRTARAVLGAFVLSGVVGVAGLTGAGTAFAETPTPVPSVAPTEAPAPAPGDLASDAPTKMPSEASAVPSPVPSEGPGQVSVVPSGAADTGVGEGSGSGSSSVGYVGAGAGAVLLAGGAFVVVRRRRATGE